VAKILGEPILRPTVDYSLLERGLREADRKFDEFKRRVEKGVAVDLRIDKASIQRVQSELDTQFKAKPLPISLDSSKTHQALLELDREIQRPRIIKLDADTSLIDRKITELEARFARMGTMGMAGSGASYAASSNTSSAFLGAGVGAALSHAIAPPPAVIPSGAHTVNNGTFNGNGNGSFAEGLALASGITPAYGRHFFGRSYAQDENTYNAGLPSAAAAGFDPVSGAINVAATTVPGMRCPNCGTINRAEATYCRNCRFDFRGSTFRRAARGVGTGARFVGGGIGQVLHAANVVRGGISAGLDLSGDIGNAVVGGIYASRAVVGAASGAFKAVGAVGGAIGRGIGLLETPRVDTLNEVTDAVMNSGITQLSELQQIRAGQMSQSGFDETTSSTYHRLASDLYGINLGGQARHDNLKKYLDRKMHAVVRLMRRNNSRGGGAGGGGTGESEERFFWRGEGGTFEMVGMAAEMEKLYRSITPPPAEQSIAQGASTIRGVAEAVQQLGAKISRRSRGGKARYSVVDDLEDMGFLGGTVSAAQISPVRRMSPLEAAIHAGFNNPLGALNGATILPFNPGYGQSGGISDSSYGPMLGPTLRNGAMARGLLQRGFFGNNNNFSGGFFGGGGGGSGWGNTPIRGLGFLDYPAQRMGLTGMAASGVSVLTGVGAAIAAGNYASSVYRNYQNNNYTSQILSASGPHAQLGMMTPELMYAAALGSGNHQAANLLTSSIPGLTSIATNIIGPRINYMRTMAQMQQDRLDFSEKFQFARRGNANDIQTQMRMGSIGGLEGSVHERAQMDIDRDAALSAADLKYDQEKAELRKQDFGTADARRKAFGQLDVERDARTQAIYQTHIGQIIQHGMKTGRASQAMLRQSRVLDLQIAQDEYGAARAGFQAQLDNEYDQTDPALRGQKRNENQKRMSVYDIQARRESRLFLTDLRMQSAAGGYIASQSDAFGRQRATLETDLGRLQNSDVQQERLRQVGTKFAAGSQDQKEALQKEENIIQSEINLKKRELAQLLSDQNTALKSLGASTATSISVGGLLEKGKFRTAGIEQSAGDAIAAILGVGHGKNDAIEDATRTNIAEAAIANLKGQKGDLMRGLFSAGQLQTSGNLINPQGFQNPYREDANQLLSQIMQDIAAIRARLTQENN
jgi:hypothetical protein